MQGNQQLMFQGGVLVFFIVVMYFLLIRPQKKKEQEVEDMRNSIRVGDNVVTIGGIVGRVVKVKEDGFIIQVGADKTKFEIKRWAVSTVDRDLKAAASSSRDDDEARKPKPKRLGKKEPEAVEAPAVEEATEVIQEPEEAAVEEAVETAVEEVTEQVEIQE